jgi:hypothetical protein
MAGGAGDRRRRAAYMAAAKAGPAQHLEGTVFHCLLRFRLSRSALAGSRPAGPDDPGWYCDHRSAPPLINQETAGRAPVQQNCNSGETNL